ncbi:uncharacterized protein LOC114532139 [Dendronephthya gigantea]|uniref:uncharacterized protein LOC114532139 n=1 Tax=Dendronephthya gigantea TaxID=151771 RepID=UPI00106CF6D7|nr:uncharacterized protein LOC114532139 [Dendronephthya gigantea]
MIVNGKRIDALTVLHFAVKKGTLEIVEYLVEQGADVNGKKTNRWTVLHSAVKNGTVEIVEYLVEKGADVNGKKNDGWCVMHAAVAKVAIDVLEIVKYLLENGADVNGKDTNGSTVLHSAVAGGTLEIVKYLVENGADVHAKDTDGWKVLHTAVTQGRLELVKCLVIKHGADVTLKSKRSVHTLGIDILIMAVEKNSVALVNLLLEKNIAVWRAGTFLVEGRQMSLLEWSIHLGHDELTTIRLKGSVNHREKIQMLKTMNCNKLEEVNIF